MLQNKIKFCFKNTLLSFQKRVCACACMCVCTALESPYVLWFIFIYVFMFSSISVLLSICFDYFADFLSGCWAALSRLFFFFSSVGSDLFVGYGDILYINRLPSNEIWSGNLLLRYLKDIPDVSLHSIISPSPEQGGFSLPIQFLLGLKRI